MSLNFKNIKKGQLLLGAVKHINQNDISISLPNFLTGYLPFKSMNIPESMQSFEKIREMYGVGELLQCYVCEIEPSCHRIELSIDPDLVNKALSNFEFSASSTVLMGTVKSVEDAGLLFDIGIHRECVIFSEAFPDFKLGKTVLLVSKVSKNVRLIQVTLFDPKHTLPHAASSNIRPGMLIEGNPSKSAQIDIDGLLVRVLESPTLDEESFVLLVVSCSFDYDSFYAAFIPKSKSTINRLQLGTACDAPVDKVFPKWGVFTKAASNHSFPMFVHISRFTDERQDRLSVEPTKLLSAMPIDFDFLCQLYIGSCQKSVISSSVVSYEQLKVGMNLNGKVVKIKEFGAIVEISPHLRCICPTTHFTESGASSASALSLNQFYKFRVLELEPLKKSCILTRKRSLVSSKHKPISSYDVPIGTVSHGYIAAIQEYGLIVRFFSSVKGLIHTNSLKKFENVKESFYVGQVVECTVISSDPVGLRLSLELFEPAYGISSTDSHLEAITKVDHRVLLNNGATKEIEAPVLTAFPTTRHLEESSHDNSHESGTNLLVASSYDSLDELYGKLLLSKPNDSSTWLAYISALIDTKDISKAKEVIKRATALIDSRFEDDKLNVWKAYLNFEKAYGSIQTLKDCFESALLQNDPLEIYLHYASLIADSNAQECLKIFSTIISKFGSDFKTWHRYIEQCFKFGEHKLAKSVLLQASKFFVDKNDDYIRLQCQYAQCEYKYGNLERGRGMFEAIISKSPKRLDVWLIYITMETNNKDIDFTRRLFERVLSTKLSSKKARFYFKKYYDFEKENGDQATLENVKSLALRYIEGN